MSDEVSTPFTPDEPTIEYSSRIAGLPPMDLAAEFVKQTRHKRELDAELARVKERVAAASERLIEIWEAGDLPASFKEGGASVFSRQELWAGPKDGDHEKLSAVLQELGLVEYLPSKVNTQSLSAYVREFIDKETEEVKIGGDDGLDPRLEAVLKISRPVKAVAQFGK